MPNYSDRLYSWLNERIDLDKYAKSFKEFTLAEDRSVAADTHQKWNAKWFWYWYPFYCLGGIAILAFIITAVTGLVLGFYYVPDGVGVPSPAYQSIVKIMTEVPFGYLVRAVHHWAAHIMVAAVFLHMLRVFFVGAYRNPRELNWVLGVGLFALTLAFGYSGYLLPWDQLAYWAGTIGQNMAKATPMIGDTIAMLVFGSTELKITPDGLARMYIYHVYILPFLVAALIIAHIIIVWLQGAAEPH